MASLSEMESSCGYAKWLRNNSNRPHVNCALNLWCNPLMTSTAAATSSDLFETFCSPSSAVLIISERYLPNDTSPKSLSNNVFESFVIPNFNFLIKPVFLLMLESSLACFRQKTSSPVHALAFSSLNFNLCSS
ncbi:uncharacterized protein ZBAI_07671 [Zygosaccharomyces bailii ISA1307]|nr:uncharacterized protein ZBAI_07671 [Zygosaccharomyces bailii ISA1307]